MELIVFAMLGAFVSGVFVAGLLSKSGKTNNRPTKPSDQLNLPLSQNAEKPSEMAAANR
ncbi:MAG: hypothetical protein ACYC92_02865 [Candidatus Acidiferrales bacterium]